MILPELKFKLKRKHRLESEFTTDWATGLKDKKGWYFKIPDIGRTIKPFDLFGIFTCGIFFAEFKVVPSDIFDYKIVRDNQFTALEDIYVNAKKFRLTKYVHSLVIVYSKKYDDYRIIDIGDIIQSEKEGYTGMSLRFKNKVDNNK